MDNQPKISILVPCYNVEKYLPQCIDSIISQTLEEIEIICLNDGSTDHTLDILKRYAESDSRINIIDKPNSGYGATMNLGLSKAKGKYIGIVESDDYIEKRMFETLYTAAEKDNLDYVRCLYREFDEVKGRTRIVDDSIYGLFECGRPFCPREQKKIFFIPPSIWAGLYRRDFLEKDEIRFLDTPGASYQDTSFAFKVLICTDKMMVIPEVLHNYRINGNSSVNSTSKVFCVCDEEAEIRRFAKSYRDGEFYGDLKEVMANRAYGAYKWNYRRLSPPLKRMFIKRWSNDVSAMFNNGEITRKYFSRSRRFRLWLVAKCPWIFWFTKRI